MHQRHHRAGVASSLWTTLAIAVLVCATGVGPASAQAPAPTKKSATSPAPAAPPAPVVAPVPDGPIGLWIDHTGRGAVEIVPCATELCGRIVWMKDPLDKRGKPFVDSQNSDKARRGSPICGLQIIGGLKQQRDGSWDNGWIYDPEQGESFDLEVRLLQEQVLQVKGYKVVKFLNETFKWQRATETPGPRCAT